MGAPTLSLAPADGRESLQATRELLTWLRLEMPSQRLESFSDLSADDFAAELRKRRPKGHPRLDLKDIAELTDTHRLYAAAEQARAARLRTLACRLSDLVLQAYRLTDDEIDLLSRTAPPAHAQVLRPDSAA